MTLVNRIVWFFHDGTTWLNGRVTEYGEGGGYVKIVVEGQPKLILVPLSDIRLSPPAS